MKKVFAVYQINNYIRQLIEDDVILSEVFIQGEVSNFKDNKHLYFTLKDDFAAINCVMFASATRSLKFKLENGMKVILFGRIGVYEKTGNYQIYVDLVEPIGVGALHLAFEQLKTKLDEEGLFDDYHKKTLPQNPRTVALITSPTGAVVQDMIRIAKRRSPSTNLIIIPTAVQGQDAPLQIAHALATVADYGKVDMAILARGGGSLEDLWAFNEEVVARAIFRFPIPIISAIGHETDVTIADFVADVRASTPSAAIEIALPNKQEQKEAILSKLQTITNIVNMRFLSNRHTITRLLAKPALKDPTYTIGLRRSMVSSVFKNLSTQFQINHIKEAQKFTLLTTSLKNLSPLNILEKGYAIVSKNSTAVNTKDELKKGDIVTIQLKDGDVSAEIL